MTRKVVWLESAIAQVASFFVSRWNTSEGQRITQAMGLLDEQLIEGADLLGESRNGFVRIAIEDPLWIHFELHDDHQLVIVTSVRYRPQLQS